MNIESNFDQKYYLSVHTLTSKQPSIYKSIDISKDLIVYGTEKNTGALFIYKRSPYAFFRAIPGGTGIRGPITLIKISHNQQFIAFANQYGELAVHALSGLLSKTISARLEAPCTSIYWHFSDKEFYIGDAHGNISVASLNFFLGRNLIGVQVHRILDDLEGPIVQIDGFNDFLLISSTTKTILCNNEREEFKQLGNRPRDGDFGSCFVIDFETLESQESKLATIDEETYESMLIENVTIYCSRPGMRLWEINLNGNILKTHQYKNANFSAQQINLLLNGSKPPSADSSPLMVDKTNQFQLAHALLNQFIFTWNAGGFYIISPKESKIIFWSNEFDGAINNAKVVGSSIYLYLKDGRLFELCFYKLQNYALHLCHSEYFLQAGDLIKNNLDFFLSLLRNSNCLNDANQYRIFLKIRDHLIANERTETLKSLTCVFDELTSKKIQNVMILGKNLFNKSNQNDEHVSTAAVENDMEDEEEEEEDDVDETPQVLPITKQFDQDSLSSISSADIDRATKQLYIIHQTSLISNLNYRERLCKIFDRYKSSQVIKILDELEKLFVENEEYNEVDAKKVVSKMFLEYLQPEIIFEIDDEKTLNYIANALLQVQTNAAEVSRCKRCEFPLNIGSSSTGYEEIQNVLQQCYWSRMKYEKCFELCRAMPHLLKITGKFLIDERKYDKMIPYAINLGDLEILHKSLELFNDISLFHQLLDDYLMAANHGKFKCLKCDETNVVNQVHKILSLNCLFQAIENYLSGHELIDLLMRYSHFIPKGEISRQFYMKLLLHACD